MSIDRSNKNWNNVITDEEIFNKEFTIGYLLQTNTHIPMIAELKEKVLPTYRVKARFEYKGYNGDAIYCNGQKLVYASNKRNREISLGKNVRIIESNLSPGGSNQYPSVAHKDGYCILEFTSYGLPYVDSVNGWSINLLELEIKKV